MSARETDLPALLIAVFAVGISTAVTPGSWDGIDSIVCIPVLVVLWAYTLSGPARRARTRPLERLAISVVLAFIFSVLFAFPVQQIFGLENHANQAFYWALIPGCIIAGILWYRTGPDRKTPQSVPAEAVN